MKKVKNKEMIVQVMKNQFFLKNHKNLN